MPLKIVHFNNGLEDREAVLDVREVIIAVNVDTMNLDFIAWTGTIDQVMQDKDFFLAGNTTRRHSTWRLLNRKLLIVTIDGLDVVYGIRAIGMANNALSE